jgi:tRNA(fMet)-specific endonuclease VapC
VSSSFVARKSEHVAANLARVEAFASAIKVLVVDVDIARRFGEIQQQLRAKGRPIPVADIWIAATAINHGLPLLTRDEHFQQVDGLRIVAWKSTSPG